MITRFRFLNHCKNNNNVGITPVTKRMIFSGIFTWLKKMFNPAPPKKKIMVLCTLNLPERYDLLKSVSKSIPIEIICIDPLVMHRHIKIGSHKPTHYFQEGVPSHLVNSLELHEEPTPEEIISRIETLIDQIHQRNKFPVLVGENTVYLRWFLYGRPPNNSVNPAVVTKLESLLQDIEKEDLPPAQKYNELCDLALCFI